jgi:hypothetical protein
MGVTSTVDEVVEEDLKESLLTVPLALGFEVAGR